MEKHTISGNSRAGQTRRGCIYRVGETAVRNDADWVGGYAPKEQTPTLKYHDGRRKTATMISAVSNQGLLRFKVQDRL